MFPNILEILLKYALSQAVLSQISAELHLICKRAYRFALLQHRVMPKKIALLVRTDRIRFAASRGYAGTNSAKPTASPGI